MATLDTDEANLVDAESFNWQAIVYPVILALLIVVGGLSYYYYTLQQRMELEGTARAALLKAKTPEEWIKVADTYPKSTQASLALMKAATASFDKRDYTAAIADYQKITGLPDVDVTLSQSARMGLASSFEAAGKTDEAINAYIHEGELGAKSPYAPFAYFSAARLYEEKGDKDNQRHILTEAASLDPDSPFVKQAQYKLKELSAASQPAPGVTMTPQSPASAPAATATPTPSAPVTPTPVPPPAPK